MVGVAGGGTLADLRDHCVAGMRHPFARAFDVEQPFKQRPRKSRKTVFHPLPEVPVEQVWFMKCFFRSCMTASDIVLLQHEQLKSSADGLILVNMGIGSF